jgi:hypothetical protein
VASASSMAARARYASCVAASSSLSPFSLIVLCKPARPLGLPIGQQRAGKLRDGGAVLLAPCLQPCAVIRSCSGLRRRPCSQDGTDHGSEQTQRPCGQCSRHEDPIRRGLVPGSSPPSLIGCSHLYQFWRSAGSASWAHHLASRGWLLWRIASSRCAGPSPPRQRTQVLPRLRSPRALVVV